MSSTLQRLKAAHSLTSVAEILGYEPSVLSYILYKLPPGQKYTNFNIVKKSGGIRQISAPSARLKFLQRSLSDVLYDCTKEINDGHERKSLSHGFKHSHSIITNAKQHKNRRYVLNIDLKDFFPTFNFGRVRGFFLKNNAFSLHSRVATVLAQIACHDGGLPQGSPCSPIISDMLAHLLDVRLVQLAKSKKCTYSRYADDITFSTSQNVFPASIAFQANEEGGEWELGQQLKFIVNNAGFTINDDKTRMQCRGSRQLVTGLTVNEKVNIRSSYYRFSRAMCDSLFSTGKYHWHGTKPGESDLSSINKIEGVLNHIYFVKDSVDARTKIEKADNPTAARALYKDLLFFKYFVNLEKPLIVCEGKTDSVYLKAAINKLPAFHPALGRVPGSTSHKISFFNYTNHAHNVLDIGGGTGGQVALIKEYQNTLAKFLHRPLKHPVILLIDNDSGSSPIFGIVKNKCNVTISLGSTASFYRLCHNLYLVKTPEPATDSISMIEDLFDPSLLAATLGGKSFNLTNKNSAANEVGKSAFAEFVRSNADKIEFTGFSPLLNRIVEVLNHYVPPAPGDGTASS